MKTCTRCLREYDEGDSGGCDPAHKLGKLFLAATNPEGEDDLCPDCREETGIFTLLGFSQ